MEKSVIQNGTYESQPQPNGNRDGCRRSRDNPKRSREVKALWRNSPDSPKSLKKWAKANLQIPIVASWAKEKKIRA